MNTNTFIEYKLTRGKGYVILIDTEDIEILNHYKLNTMKTDKSYTRYVVCQDKITRKYIGLLHRIVMNVFDKNILIDHINGNGLDCRKANLRQATPAQNQHNRRSTNGNVKGVWFRQDRNKWAARITINNTIINLGHFNSEKEAIKARAAAEKEHYGEFLGNGTELIS